MKKMSKRARSNLITYGIVILAYAACEIWMRTGNMSSLMEGLLVPLCVYAILAVSLNLTVGILGELSLGHSGFMCVGAFASAWLSTLWNVRSAWIGCLLLIAIIPLMVRSRRA